MRSVAPARLRGFSLVEVVIAVSIVSVMAAIAAAALGPWLAFRQGLETERRLKELAAAMEAAYRDNAIAMEAASGPVLAYPGGAIADGTVAGDATFQAVARFSSLSSALLGRDGFNMPVRVFVSPRLSQTVGGVVLYYHMAAVVSGGRNGRIETGTAFDPATGRLTIAGDDKGFVLDGYRVQRALYELTASRMQRIVQGWQQYYQSRYLSDPSRSVSIDYFGRPGAPAARWDPGNAVAHTGGAPAAASAIGLGIALGLAAADMTDAYGNGILADNSSTATRNPGHPDPAMAAPPYTARVIAQLPGGAVLELSAIATY